MYINWYNMMGKFDVLETVPMGMRGEDEEEKEIIFCGLGVCQYLGIAGLELNNSENPRILSVLTSILERAIDRNGIDLAKATRHSTKFTSKIINSVNDSHNNRLRIVVGGVVDHSEEINGRRLSEKRSDNVNGDIMSRINDGALKSCSNVEDNLRRRVSENGNSINGIEDGNSMNGIEDDYHYMRRNIIRQKLSMFNGMRAPSIGIESYIRRINKYARCSPCCYVLAYAYMSKISACLHHYPLINHVNHNHNNNPTAANYNNNPLLCFISPFNIHRLLITSIMLAAKFMDDSHFNNAYFAKIGGVSTMEMNGLEMAFLKMVEYRLHISPKDFEKLCSHFGKESAMQAILVTPPPPPPP
eukprot:c40194_g1_i1 orf=2-1072(-)